MAMAYSIVKLYYDQHKKLVVPTTNIKMEEDGKTFCFFSESNTDEPDFSQHLYSKKFVNNPAYYRVDVVKRCGEYFFLNNYNFLVYCF